jgi:hypothetical protein
MTARDPIGHGAPPFRGEPDRPLADEPRSLIDSWPFLVCFGVAVGVLYVARAWGWV